MVGERASTTCFVLPNGTKSAAPRHQAGRDRRVNEADGKCATGLREEMIC